MKRKNVVFNKCKFVQVLFYKIGDTIANRLSYYGHDDTGTVALSFRGIEENDDEPTTFYIFDMPYTAIDYMTIDQDILDHTDEDNTRHHILHNILMMGYGYKVDDITSECEFIIDIKCNKANWGICVKISNTKHEVDSYRRAAKDDETDMDNDEILKDEFYNFVHEIVDKVVDDMFKKTVFMEIQ